MHNNLLKYSIVSVLCVLSALSASAQRLIRFQNITVNDGLSMSTITDFEQDHNGYIWIATAEGLHRYDGKHFKILKHSENVSNSLSDSYVHDILSYDHNLYVGTNLGTIDIISELDYTTRHLDLRKYDSTFDYSISHLLVHQDRIIINTDGGGLWQYDPALNKARRIQVKDIGNESIRQLKIDNNSLLLATAHKIIRTDLNTTSVLFNDQNILITDVIRYKNHYLIGTENGLYQTDLNFRKLTKLNVPPRKRYINKINTIAVQSGVAWIGTSGGLLKLEHGRFSLYRSNVQRPYSLVNDNISDLFVDKDNLLWIGTIAGVSTYAPQLNKFGLLQYFEIGDQTYSNNVYCTYEDQKGTIWLGTLASGLVKLNEDNTIAKIYPRIVDGPFESNSVRSIFEDSKGNFWIGTSIDGIFLFDRKTEKFTAVANREKGNVDFGTTRHFYEDRDHNLWIGTPLGLYLKSPDNGTFTKYISDKSHANNSIYQITEHPTENKLILASFRGGLQIFDKTTETFETYKSDETDSLTINSNNLMSLQWINDDTLLIGTYGGGLNLFDLKSKQFSAITETEGLVNNVVYGVLYQGNGKCWLSTNNGIVQYDIYNKSFVNFKPVHYLQSTEYNEGAFCKSSDGTYYFGGVNGLNFFKPNQINFDTTGSPIFITDVRGEFTDFSKNSYSLSFLNSRLEIDFTSLYYINPEGINYSYRLRGYDNDWVSATGTNTAVYPRLSPGSYIFEVLAEDEFGNWSTSSDDLKIMVNPPLWQKWWFILVSIITIATLIYALFKYRTRAIERSYKLQLVDSELTALRSQMNPHFIFNSLNSIQYFILKKEPREAYTYLSKFASLMRKILQNSRLKYISVADEVEGLDLYLEMEKLRMDNNLDYTIKTRNIADLENTNMPTMLIQPFVENSIIHGLLPKKENRKLNILISCEKQYLLCTITDNGIGREAASEMNAKRSSKHTSAGMNLTQQRLKILSEGQGNFDVKVNDLSYEDGSKGTEVKLVVPIITQTD